uniref:F-box protein n=1 Tax=Heterorhabditis bacteriophora TaxID=37862 RepID=A0A1I7WPZ4_HETBA
MAKFCNVDIRGLRKYPQWFLEPQNISDHRIGHFDRSGTYLLMELKQLLSCARNNFQTSWGNDI